MIERGRRGRVLSGSGNAEGACVKKKKKLPGGGDYKICMQVLQGKGWSTDGADTSKLF